IATSTTAGRCRARRRRCRAGGWMSRARRSTVLVGRALIGRLLIGRVLVSRVLVSRALRGVSTRPARRRRRRCRPPTAAGSTPRGGLDGSLLEPLFPAVEGPGQRRPEDAVVVELRD